MDDSKQSIGGKTSSANMTAEERKERASNAAKAMWAKKVTPDNIEAVIEALPPKEQSKPKAKPGKGRVLYSTGEPASPYEWDIEGNPYDPFAEPWIAPKGWNLRTDNNPMSWERYKCEYIINDYQQQLRDA